MIQNRSSSHANTETSISGHCLDSSGKSMEWVVNETGVSLSRKINGDLRLRQKKKLSQNIFVDLELDLELFVQKKQRRRNFGSEYFHPKREGRGTALRINLSKRVKRRKGVK